MTLHPLAWFFGTVGPWSVSVSSELIGNVTTSSSGVGGVAVGDD